MNNIIQTLHFVPDVSAEHSMSQLKFYCNLYIYIYSFHIQVFHEFECRYI